MITKLKLVNYRQHRNSVIEFVPGINTIIGANNSGKSTIPEAIEFALYGSKALRDSAKAYISDGQDEGSAIVLFDVEGTLVSVGRNSKDAMVHIDGKAKAKYKSAVTQYIGNVTGVNHAGFRLGHYVRQKELAFFANLRPGKRHEAVERMLKVNAVDIAIKALKELIDENDVRLKALTAQYRSPETIDDQLIDIEIVSGSLSKAAEDLKRDLEEVKELLVIERDTERAIAVNNAKICELRGRLDDIKVRYDSLPNIEEERERINGELSKLTRLSDELCDELQNRHRELQDTRVAYNKAQGVKKELQELSNLQEPKEVQEPSVPIDTDIVILKRKRSELLADLKQYSNLETESVCSRCQQPIPVEHLRRLIDSVKDSLVDTNNELFLAEATYRSDSELYRQQRKARDEYLTAHARWRKDFDRRTRLTLELVEVDFDEEELSKVSEALRQVHLQREAWLKLAGELKRLDDRRNERMYLEQDMQEVTFRLGECGPYLDYDGPLRDLEASELELQKCLRDNTEALAHCSGRITELRKQLKIADENKLNIERQAMTVAKLKAQRDNFVLFKRHLTSKIRPKLQEVSESLFHKVTKNRYASYQLSDSYDISLTTHKGYVRKLATISGSENDLACLCLRLAIATLSSSKLAGNLGFIILDEISGAFDDSRTKETLTGLLELREVIPQIINITHKPVEIKFADRLITVTESNGVSGVVWRDA